MYELPANSAANAFSPRLRRLVWGLLGLTTTASVLGSAFSPYLLVRHPLWLVALSPDARHVVLSAGSVAPLSVILIGAARRVLMCVAAFGAGVLYGATAVSWLERRYPRLGALLRYFERLFARWGAPLLILAPTPTLCVLAGAARTRVPAFLAAVSVGQLASVAIAYFVGDLLSAWTDLLIDFLSRHLIESTLIVVSLVAGAQLLSWWRSRAGRAASSAFGGR